MKLKAVLNEFIYECQIKHFTPQTIKSYRNGNNLMINWLNINRNITEIEEVKPSDLKAYLASKLDNHSKDTYIILECKNIEQACGGIGFYNSLIIQHQI